MKALEIPTHPRDGVSLDALAYALEHQPIAACLFVLNFNNPLGSCMPDENKRLLVEMLAEREIPLIEDDIYGDVSFTPQRPKTAKAFDKKGLVLLCDSFSKTLAPGYRVGWVAPGRFQEKVELLKTVSTIATATLPQMAIADFLANGGYAHHLRRVQRVYADQVNLVSEAIAKYFPEETKLTRPSGGQVLWLNCPAASIPSNSSTAPSQKRSASPPAPFSQPNRSSKTSSVSIAAIRGLTPSIEPQDPGPDRGDHAVGGGGSLVRGRDLRQPTATSQNGEPGKRIALRTVLTSFQRVYAGSTKSELALRRSGRPFSVCDGRGTIFCCGFRRRERRRHRRDIVTMDPHTLDESHHEHANEEIDATATGERQRLTGGGKHADVHRHVPQSADKQHCHHSHDQHPPQFISGGVGDMNAKQKQKQKERHLQQSTQKAKLLHDDSKDEVVDRLRRSEKSPVHRAPIYLAGQRPLPCKASRSYRHLHLVAHVASPRTSMLGLVIIWTMTSTRFFW